MEFRKHGDFKIVVDNRIITSELIGPWNIETARDYIARLDATVERRGSTESWGSVVVCLESVQFPLEMIVPLRASVQKRVALHNQAAIAMVVAPDVEGYGVLFPTIRSIYEGLIPFEIFDTRPQAMAWIRGFL